MSELFCWLRAYVAMLNSDLRLKWTSSLPCCLHHEPRTKRGYRGLGEQHLLANKSCPVLVVSASTATSASDGFGFTLVDRVRLEGFAVYFGDRDFGFALADRVRLEGFTVCLRRATTSASPSLIEFGSRGSPSTSASATSASPWSIEFGSRGSPSTSATATSASSSSTEFGLGRSPFYFGEHDFGFALADGVRLEALAVGLRQATTLAFARVGRA